MQWGVEAHISVVTRISEYTCFDSSHKLLTVKLPDNNCRLLCHLLVILKVIFANSVDPDQTAPLGTV